MNTTRTCSQCGRPVAANSLQGLCPECMMKVGLADQTGETVPDSARGSKPHSRPPPPPLAEVAKFFPQLEILECIGCGGMGAVYKARQPRLDRLVALKILVRDCEETTGDARFAERFEREARALARLHHPNIVTMYEFGQVEGLPYFIMEYVDGLSLRQLERAGRLGPSAALQIIPQICEALQFAHDEGVVHRDIKPENILLDNKGRVKIADFGIAKILGREAGAVGLTETKQAIGTPHYMAPEQVERPQSVDHRADIYSLGVVFYELLTGELPLGKFAPPSRKVQVDVRLDEVVLHALEKEPERRYQHAGEVKTDVETIVSSESQGNAMAPVDAPRAPLANKSPLVRIVEILCDMTFTSLLAVRLINISALGFLAFLAFLGYVPLPGWQRCFGFSCFGGFFGLIGAAFLIERAAQRKAKVPPSKTGAPESVPDTEQMHGRTQWKAIGLLIVGIVSWVAIALFVLHGARQDASLSWLLLLLAPLAAMMVLLLRRKVREAFPGADGNSNSSRGGRAKWASRLLWSTIVLAALASVAAVLTQTVGPQNRPPTRAEIAKAREILVQMEEEGETWWNGFDKKNAVVMREFSERTSRQVKDYNQLVRGTGAEVPAFVLKMVGEIQTALNSNQVDRAQSIYNDLTALDISLDQLRGRLDRFAPAKP